jgi:hypothetical protein
MGKLRSLVGKWWKRRDGVAYFAGTAATPEELQRNAEVRKANAAHGVGTARPCPTMRAAEERRRRKLARGA